MKPRLRIVPLPLRGNWQPLRGNWQPLRGNWLPARRWLPSHRWLPPTHSRARLPLVLALVLAVMAVGQLAWPERIDLLPAGAVARIGLAPLPAAPPVVIASQQLASRDLFTPPSRQPGTDGPGDPLDGAVIAGVIQKGRLRLGVVQQSGGPGAPGQVRYVELGGTIAGWRLAALDQGEARLTRGPGENLRVTYGLHAVPTRNSTPPSRNSYSPQNIESGQ